MHACEKHNIGALRMTHLWRTSDKVRKTSAYLTFPQIGCLISLNSERVRVSANQPVQMACSSGFLRCFQPRMQPALHNFRCFQKTYKCNPAISCLPPRGCCSCSKVLLVGSLHHQAIQTCWLCTCLLVLPCLVAASYSACISAVDLKCISEISNCMRLCSTMATAMTF